VPTTEYVIRDRTGVHVATHVRIDEPGGKRFTWKRPDGRSGLNGTPAADLPLYGIHKLGGWTDATTVVVAEGEKAATALLGRSVAAVGVVTGAGTVPSTKSLPTWAAVTSPCGPTPTIPATNSWRRSPWRCVAWRRPSAWWCRPTVSRRAGTRPTPSPTGWTRGTWLTRPSSSRAV
jgi:hypothetical protein